MGGNAWASMLLGVPREASYRNILEVDGGGWTDGLFVQDQIKATSRLTVNVGFRNDLVWQPIYGTGKGGNFYTGNANPITGQYELNALPPNCSATQGAPCIPTGIYTASSTPAPGGLPAHAFVNPASDHRVIKNSFARLGWPASVWPTASATRRSSVQAIAASTTRGPQWSSSSQNFGGNWPAVNTLDNAGLNVNAPTAPANDPLALGNGGALIYPINDFSQVSQWMVDPNFRTPYMDQWNVGVERQLPANAVLDANYVGSVGRHLDWGPTMNTPVSGTWRCPVPAAVPLHAAAMVRPERRKQPLQRHAGHSQQTDQPWRYIPGRLHLVALKRRRLRAGGELQLDESLQPEGRLRHF